jgi:membrane fusion protein (multidrug efflux system)
MHVAIQNGQRQAVAVPEAAVQADSDQSYVYVIVRQGARTIARQTPVQIGVNENGFVEITQGLAANTPVVADGLDRVEPNAPLRVVGAHAGQGRTARGRSADAGGLELRLRTL